MSISDTHNDNKFCYNSIAKGHHMHIQGGVTLTASVLRSATAVKTKVNGQIKIFAIIKGQATIAL